MAKKVEVSKFPLEITVTKSFPLRRIKEVNIKLPGATYRDDITVNQEQAQYLSQALSEILNEEVKDTTPIDLGVSNG